MSIYKSNPQVVKGSVDCVYDKIANPSQFQQYLDRLPAEALAKIGDIKFTDDSIAITAAPVGEIMLNIVERQPGQHVKFAAGNLPVKMETIIELQPADADSTNLTTAIDVEIPAMLRPMIGGKMQEAADKMAELLGTLLNNSII